MVRRGAASPDGSITRPVFLTQANQGIIAAMSDPSSKIITSFQDRLELDAALRRLGEPLNDTDLRRLAADIAEKYGPANRRTGKYLDQKTTWLFPAGENRPNSIVLEIQRSSNAAAAAFFVKVEYTYGVTQKIIEDKKKSTTKKDL